MHLTDTLHAANNSAFVHKLQQSQCRCHSARRGPCLAKERRMQRLTVHVHVSLCIPRRVPPRRRVSLHTCHFRGEDGNLLLQLGHALLCRAAVFHSPAGESARVLGSPSNFSPLLVPPVTATTRFRGRRGLYGLSLCSCGRRALHVTGSAVRKLGWGHRLTRLVRASGSRCPLNPLRGARGGASRARSSLLPASLMRLPYGCSMGDLVGDGATRLGGLASAGASCRV